MPSPIVVEVPAILRNSKGFNVNKAQTVYHFVFGEDTANYLRLMIKDREDRGESLSPDSWLFRSHSKWIREKTILKEGSEIIINFLQTTDSMIEKNIGKITCDVLGRLYFEMFHQLKAFRGTSGNFVGYGEYLVFCAVKSVLGGVWKGPSEEKITELERFQFTQGLHRLAQGYRYDLKEKYPILNENGTPKLNQKTHEPIYKQKFEPDIALLKGEILHRYFSIKTWFQRKIVIEEIKFIEHVLRLYPTVRIMLISLDEISGPLEKTLNDKVSKMKRFSFTALRGNPKLFTTCVNEM